MSAPVDVLAVLREMAGQASNTRWSNRTTEDSLTLLQLDSRYEKALASVAAIIEERDALRAILAYAVDTDGGTAYAHDEDEIGYRACCGVISYKPHEPGCWVARATAIMTPRKDGA